MLTQSNKQTILAASIVLSTEAAELFKTYQKCVDDRPDEAFRLYEKFLALNRMSSELNIVASSNF
jgi:hypothetical protein